MNEREAFEAWANNQASKPGDSWDWPDAAWAAWQAALAQPAVPEPLDVCTDADNCKRCKAPQRDKHKHHHAGLTAQPAVPALPVKVWVAHPAVTLTDEQIDKLLDREQMRWISRNGPPTYEFAAAFARAVLAAAQEKP